MLGNGAGDKRALTATASKTGEKSPITRCLDRDYCEFLRPNIDEIDDEIDDVVSGFFGSSTGAAAAAARFEVPCLLR